MSRRLRSLPLLPSVLAFVAACAGLVGGVARAQPTEDKTYDGTWSARLQGSDGRARDATLVIDGYDGTWQERGGGRAAKGGCGGKKIPLTVQSSTRKVLQFTVWGETLGPACPTLTVVVEPRGEKVLEGVVDLGAGGEESAELHAGHGAAADAAAPASGAERPSSSARRGGSAGTLRLTRR